MLYYSKSTGGFYDDAIHGQRKIPDPNQAAEAKALHPAVLRLIDNPNCKIPADAVEISPKLHRELLDRQSKGMVIVPDNKGMPKAVQLVLTPEQIRAGNRIERDRLLSASDWTQLSDTLLDKPDYKAAMANWRQALRDMDLEAGVIPEEPQP